MSVVQARKRYKTPVGEFGQFDLVVLVTTTLLVTVIGLLVTFGTPPERPLRVAYLQAEGQGLYNLWVADPTDLGSARQVTFTEYGVFDFDVSPDGRYIAYSERDFSTGVAEIMLYDLLTGNTRQLTNCVMQDADCTAPAFRPGQQMIAYERRELNTALGTGVGANRIWLLELVGDPPGTYPLFDDSAVLGYGARWSADGTRIALYDNANGGILVYDFEASGDSAIHYIPSDYGEVGAFSPDGRQMIFPEMVFDGRQARAHLQVANLDEGFFQVLTDPVEGTNDPMARWSPDGRYIAIARTYTDERYTRGAQIYLMNTSDGSVTPLIFDERYANGIFQWSPESDQLVIQRFPVLDEDGNVPTDASGTTEIWTYNLATGQLMKMAEDARNPRWVAR